MKGIQKIVKEEGEKIGIMKRVSEQSGTSIGALLTTPDLSGCLYQGVKYPSTEQVIPDA